MSNKVTEIDSHISEIHELLDEGFSPEEYHEFLQTVENHLSKIEILTTDLRIDIGDMVKETGLLTLYPEDFKKTHDWIAVCQQLGINASVSEVTIKTSGIEMVDPDNGDNDE